VWATVVAVFISGSPHCLGALALLRSAGLL
jgi:hypothetical protein